MTETLVDPAVFNDSIQGWQAKLDMVFSYRQQKTVLSRLDHHGPLRVQRPFYPEPEVCHVYMLHPPGGLVGGDALHINVHCTTLAHCLLTTPGSAKFYRSAGAQAQVRQSIRIDEGATVEWFPHENIFFPGARAVIGTDVYLQENSRFIGWDITCLGRPVNHEQFTHGSIDSRFTLYRLGKPVLLERLRVSQPRHLYASAGLRSYPMVATFIATGCNQQKVELARELLAEYKPDFPCGITLVEDVLVLRILGERTEKIQAVMIPLWKALRPLLLDKPAVLPRIWST
jgi:urease accessory protein